MYTYLDAVTDALLVAQRHMGVDAFRELLADPRLAPFLSAMPSSLPKYLEMAGGRGDGGLDCPAAFAVLAFAEAAYHGG